MPDNWNILASLLGTPRPPEPVAEKAVAPKKPAAEAGKQPAPETPASETSATKSSQTAVERDARSDLSRSSLRDSHSAGGHPSASSTEKSVQPAAAWKSDEADVLDALTAVQPPPRLPGFGVPEQEPAATPASATRPTAARPSAPAPSGFGAVEGDIQQRESILSAGRDSKRSDDGERTRRGGRPPRSNGGSGFASGLGGDKSSDVEFADDDPADDDPAGDDFGGFVGDELADVDATDEGAAPPRAGRESDRDSRSQRADRPRAERANAEDRSVGAADHGSRGGEQESDDETSPSRRRGRRGQRQQMSVGDVADVPRSESPAAESDDDFGQPRRGAAAGRDRNPRPENRGPRQEAGRETRSRDVAPARSERPSSSRDEQSGSADRDRGGSASRTPERDGFGAGVTSETDAEDSPRRSRSRRGGQRGNAGGSEPRSEAPREPEPRRGRPEPAETRSQRQPEPASDDDDDDDVGFAADLFDDFESFGLDDSSVDDSADTGAPRDGSQADKDDDEGPRAGRRSRRGGRRRGRRGAGATENGDAETSVPANKGSSDLPRSAFADLDDDLDDDDLDDDGEVKATRPRSRSEGGDRSRGDSNVRPGAEKPDDAQERPRRGGRGRGREARDEEPSSKPEPGAKQDFPSWNELVNSVVDKNLTGRRSGGGGNARGGNGGGNGGGNRGGSTSGSRGRRR